ncbi:O-antigen ligase family protein [Flavihumibacter sp. CACIAM 22H1]|uniref:O-antigen ligase family protein n=1 Tax=Flavihumibacter sp. CACIAM 22H1 TaxID=1812911 RepID=UPI0007A913F6|nr:O-antigen ligase family protein [Flavihumibacter sp. CACIAM 22H1]KYP15964.1 MAG: hypothetical protein A1D16_06800 [Flavihumibacter sp. CACIAM 22H1]
MLTRLYHTTFTRKELIYYGVLCLFGFFLFLASFWEPFKYLKYGMPFLLFFIILLEKNKILINIRELKQNKRFHYLASLLLFFLVAFAINFIKGFSNPRFYAEVYFVVSPILFALLIVALLPTTDLKKGVQLLFYTITLSFLAEKFIPIIQAITHPGQLISAFLTSELESESNYSFQFGMFLLVFMWDRNKLMSILAAGLLLLSFKRIAIFAVVVIGVLYLVQKISRNRFKPAENKFLLFLSNILVVTLLFLFFTGKFDSLIEETFGVSSNFITQGRYNVYQDIFAHFGQTELLGFGLGSINTFLSGAGYQLVNLHSDVLKVFFELGPPIFIAWIILYYSYVTNFLTAALAIYMNILFFTDNVFIYFDVLFIFYFLMLYSFQFDQKQVMR